ncbi:CapA family protein [Anaerosphaera multitolerans]|uniref:CapA family protein n=1 Tax=Anaerosphaera multitolerans TaxID=2487351 RepID=A0A437S4H3_9FIRM|nr:CapA family protein [Anaerosphaera multitolerans]RVU53909.1 CapA family protein [Anaerosphaera multitolerans]
MKKIISIIATAFLLVLGIFVADYYNEGYIKEILLDSDRNILISAEEDEISTVKILATGDIMYHLPLYIKTLNSETGKYDFSTYYEKMRDQIEASDIVVGNFETTVNPNWKLSGHPMFNTPIEALEYLKSAGFDILSTANNHCLDTSIEGVETTIEAIESVGLQNFGTYNNGERKLLTVEENGIKVGFLAYTESFNGLDYGIEEEKLYMLSPMDESLITSEIEELKSQGTDFIVIYPHWGVEYRTVPSDYQRQMNEFFLNAGADVVLGSHPHVLQPVEYREIDGENKFSIYSMGNSISNQRKPWLLEKGVEFGSFVELTVEKNMRENKTALKSVDVMPTYVNRFMDVDGIYKYETVLLNDLVDGGRYRDVIDDATKNFIDSNYQWVMDVLNNEEVKN